MENPYCSCKLTRSGHADLSIHPRSPPACPRRLTVAPSLPAVQMKYVSRNYSEYMRESVAELFSRYMAIRRHKVEYDLKTGRVEESSLLNSQRAHN